MSASKSIDPDDFRSCMAFLSRSGSLDSSCRAHCPERFPHNRTNLVHSKLATRSELHPMEFYVSGEERTILASPLLDRYLDTGLCLGSVVV